MEKLDAPRWDHAIAATMLILELFEDSRDEPKHRIASQIQFICYHMLESFEREQNPRPLLVPSAN